MSFSVCSVVSFGGCIIFLMAIVLIFPFDSCIMSTCSVVVVIGDGDWKLWLVVVIGDRGFTCLLIIYLYFKWKIHMDVMLVPHGYWGWRFLCSMSISAWLPGDSCFFQNN